MEWLDGFRSDRGLRTGMRTGDGTNAFAGFGARAALNRPQMRIRRLESDVKMRRQIGQRGRVQSRLRHVAPARPLC